MTDEEYIHCVEHPRFGRGPRYTGLNPQTDYEAGTFLHWHSIGSCRIANTAVVANLDRQVAATVPVTHYYDVWRKCRNCRREFIFFAAEQRYWYEELQFSLNSDCVRCVPCRKQQRSSRELRDQYESLFHQPDRDERQSLTMAECCLTLMENRVFTVKQCQRVRALINRVQSSAFASRVAKIRQRLALLEAKNEPPA